MSKKEIAQMIALNLTGVIVLISIIYLVVRLEAIGCLVSFVFLAFVFYPKTMDMKSLSKKDIIKIIAVMAIYVSMLVTFLSIVLNATSIMDGAKLVSGILIFSYILTSNAMK